MSFLSVSAPAAAPAAPPSRAPVNGDPVIAPSAAPPPAPMAPPLNARSPFDSPHAVSARPATNTSPVINLYITLLPQFSTQTSTRAYRQTGLPRSISFLSVSAPAAAPPAPPIKAPVRGLPPVTAP